MIAMQVTDKNVMHTAPPQAKALHLRLCAFTAVYKQHFAIHRHRLCSRMPSESRQLMPAPAESAQAMITTVTTVKTEQSPPIAPSVSAPAVPEPPVTESDPSSPPAAPSKMASAVPSVPVSTRAPEPTAKPRSGWIIQIGALPDEKDARQRLELAQTKVKDILGKADPFTERVEKGGDDALIGQLADTDDPAQQTALLTKLDTRIWSQAAGMPLYAYPTLTAVDARVTGVTRSSLAGSVFWDAWAWKPATASGTPSNGP